MRKKAVFTLIILGVFFFIPAGSQAQEKQGETIVTAAASECPIAVPEDRDIECGFLMAPANYDEPAGDNVRLPYILIPSKNGDPEPDPLIFTTGGPGYSSMDNVWGFVDSPINEDRDIIIFEQRGNRYARPSLTCDSSFWWDEAEGQTPCLDSLLAQGIDMTDYVTRNIAADIVQLRKALGYEQWNLFGSSYSTTLMLLVMEMDPEATRSVILQSVRPPQVTTFNHEADHLARAIKLMFADCASDPECEAAYPDLETDFLELIRTLNRDPLKVEILDKSSGETMELTADGDIFSGWILGDSFYHPTFLPGKTPYLPLIITESNKGNIEPLKDWLQVYWRGMIENENWALGLLLAVNCQESLNQAEPELTTEDKEASEWLGGYQWNARSREICEAWELPVEPPPADSPIESDIPTLVLAGAYDPVTPPKWSKETAEALTNSTYVEFPSAGHDVTDYNPCAQGMMAEFVTDPEGEVDKSCLAGVPGPAFVLPDDIYIAPGIEDSASEVNIGDPRGIGWLETMITISIFVLFGCLLALIVGGLVRLFRRRKSGERLSVSAVSAYLLALALVIVTLALPVLLTMINNYQYTGDYYFAWTFGIPADFAPMRLLALGAPLMVILFAALAALAIWAWVKGKWSLPLRILTTVVVLAAVPAIYLGVRWDLFGLFI